MTDEELRYRMERVTERMAGANDTDEVLVSAALMRELFGRMEQMQAKLDAVPVEAIKSVVFGADGAEFEDVFSAEYIADTNRVYEWLNAQVQS